MKQAKEKSIQDYRVELTESKIKYTVERIKFRKKMLEEERAEYRDRKQKPK
jgi:hypothetical protein